jgi:lipid II:glycine glycyltransferase (peptidoglycan interpeptide bridge formation enzyme)
LAAKRVGAVSEHLAIYSEDGNIIGLSDVRIKRLPMGLGGIAYISGGPLVDRGSDSINELLPKVLNALKKEYSSKGFVLRILPRHKVDSLCTVESQSYQACGFKVQGRTNATMLIDLSVGKEQLRKGLHQKWRNVLNKSERQDIEIIAGDDLSFFDAFEGLFNELLSVKGFDVKMDNQFFANVQRLSPIQERFYMAIAYHGGVPVAGHLSSIGGDTSVYLLGAANGAGRMLGASYLLQWHVINESIARGCHFYDLGGVDEQYNPHVYQFKQRMGGVKTDLGNIFQFNAGWRSRLTLLAEKMYQLVKG